GRDVFRLRVQGLHRLTTAGEMNRRRIEAIERYTEWPSLHAWAGRARTDNDEALALVTRERGAVLAEFRRQVSEASARADASAPNLFVWENLSQNVYSVDLVRLALGAGRVDPE